MPTIEKRGQSYRFVASCGYDLEGRQIRKSTTWTPPDGMTPKRAEKEAQRQAVLFEEKCRTGQVLDGNITFAAFAERWLVDYAEKQLRPTTIRNYKDIIARINCAIGHIRLDHLKPHHIISFYNNLLEVPVRENITAHMKDFDLKAHIKTAGMTQAAFHEKAGISKQTLLNACRGQNISRKCAEQIATAVDMSFAQLFNEIPARPLDPASVRKHHAVLSSVLSTAVEWQVIFSNPCERVKPPKVERKQAVYLDEVQAAQLLSLLEGETIQRRSAVTLLLFSGMRRGELCGLEWKDVDFSNNLVQIRRSSLYLPERGIFVDETKNASSVRAVKLPVSTMQVLRRLRAEQAEHRLKLGDQWQDSDRLFTQWNGAPMHPDTFTRWFRGFISKTDLPQIHIHSLRHTNATLQIAGGIPLTAVANRLGHADIATTGKIYAHAIKTANEAAANVLEDMLNPNNRKRA